MSIFKRSQKIMRPIFFGFKFGWMEEIWKQSKKVFQQDFLKKHWDGRFFLTLSSNVVELRNPSSLSALSSSSMSFESQLHKKQTTEKINCCWFGSLWKNYQMIGMSTEVVKGLLGKRYQRLLRCTRASKDSSRTYGTNKWLRFSEHCSEMALRD